MEPTEVFARFPELQSRRLVLRALSAGDAPALFRVLADDQVTRYYDLESLTDVSQAAELIQRFQQRYSRGVGLRWAIARREAPGSLLGACGYNVWWQASSRGLLGYELARSEWRQGIMSEALAAIMDFGFREMNLNRIEATVFVDNAASRGLLTQLGFQPEGILRQYEFIKGRFEDMAMYSCLRREREER